MRANAIRSIIIPVVKVVLLALLIGLGIVFVPDGFFDRLERGLGATANFFQDQLQKHLPGVVQDAAQQAEETKGNVENLYQQIKNKYYPNAVDWFWNTVKRY